MILLLGEGDVTFVPAAQLSRREDSSMRRSLASLPTENTTQNQANNSLEIPHSVLYRLGRVFLRDARPNCVLCNAYLILHRVENPIPNIQNGQDR